MLAKMVSWLMMVLMWLAIGTYAVFGIYGAWLWLGDMMRFRRRVKERMRRRRVRI